MGEYKLGRLPQRAVGNRLAIKWAHEYMKVGPTPTYPVDVSGGLKDWGMLGNDSAGDCGEAGQLHYQMATSLAAGKPVTFTTQDALNEYFAYTGGQDTGVVLADFLLWLYNKGEILGFAPVDLSQNVDGLMGAFYGLYCGVNLTDDAQQLFQNGVWNVSNGQQPDPYLGHCILKVRATSKADTYVTWGALQVATADWSAACVEEAWVVITTEDQAAGIDLAALQADITALGGKVNPSPGPAPTPTPSPTPQPPGCNPLGRFFRRFQ